MSLAEMIGAKIRNAKSSDPQLHIKDFQVRVQERGAILINLKTGESVFINSDEDAFAIGSSLIQ